MFRILSTVEKTVKRNARAFVESYFVVQCFLSLWSIKELRVKHYKSYYKSLYVYIYSSSHGGLFVCCFVLLCVLRTNFRYVPEGMRFTICWAPNPPNPAPRASPRAAGRHRLTAGGVAFGFSFLFSCHCLQKNNNNLHSIRLNSLELEKYEIAKSNGKYAPASGRFCVNHFWCARVWESSFFNYD